MSTLEDIDKAVSIFTKANCPFVLMHTISTYPSSEEDLNLRCMLTLRERYKCKIGYSGHENGIAVSFAAAALGITSLERHITLDRSMYGSDQSASLEEPGLRNLVNSVRKIRDCVGSSDKQFQDGEKAVASKLRYWEK